MGGLRSAQVIHALTVGAAAALAWVVPLGPQAEHAALVFGTVLAVSRAAGALLNRRMTPRRIVRPLPASVPRTTRDRMTAELYERLAAQPPHETPNLVNVSAAPAGGAPQDP